MLAFFVRFKVFEIVRPNKELMASYELDVYHNKQT